MSMESSSETGLEQRPGAKARKIKKVLGLVLGLGAIVPAVILVVEVARKQEAHPQSRDGIVTANVVGIAPRVAGPILKIHVKDDQLVRKGEVLFEIDPEPFEWAAKSARANVEAIDGELLNAKTGIAAQTSEAKAAEAGLEKARSALKQATNTYARLEPLAGEHYVSAETLDSARAARDMAAATVAMAESEVAAANSAIKSDAPVWAKRHAAEAMLGQAELAVRDCRVVAPCDGRVVGLKVSEGAFAIVGVSVLTLIDMNDWHVEANFLEGDLRRIRPGAEVSLEIMTDPGKAYRGRVESIGSGVSQLPELPAAIGGLPVVRRELDWVRLAQRFPVRIRMEPEPPEEVLKVGAVVTATVKGGP